ncbi:outer membrane receptor protein involved in Fe transport [Luteibacter rhizovicinus]|uniref:Outer membrane receptor protein involved in Fe transport n=1 Tax=Luteibacter rhizovicinus TaxID=242606 RepID=A0A4R3YLE3_9GAMM|nr:TonB-dependent receptor [Luteibacter rhizovicinus]TCV93397.1 outer membrane receptor protein involved in Fe transport [Luteibacter rhizovicinus]
MKQDLRHTLLYVALLSAALTVDVVQAQDAAGTGADQTKADKKKTLASDTPQTLEGITVTAAKREQDIQKVPISMTALTGEQLERQGVTSLADLARIAPSLTVASSGPGENNLIIRGISSSAGSAATVGYYLDDVPIAASSNAALLSTRGVIDPSVFDIERVEVLRGPQGTIYGSSSMGGTVKYVTNQPDLDNVEARIKTDVSGTHHGGANANVNGVLNIPLMKDKVALRVSAYYRDDDGYIDRYPISPSNYLAADPSGKKQDNVNTYKTYGARIAMLIKPDDTLTITPSVIYQYSKLGSPFTYDKIPASLNNPYQVRDVNEANVQKSTISNIAIHKQFDTFELMSSTSYFTRDISLRDDSSKVINYFFGLPSVYPVTMYGSYKNKEFTEEVRATSKFDGPVQAILGAFYHDVRAPLTSSIPYPAGFNQTFGTPFPAYSTIYAGARNATLDEYAVFGELSWNITDKLKASAGIRAFEVKQGFSQSGDGLLNGGPSSVHSSSKDYGSTPKFTLQYQIDADNMVYATASEGYRPGGPNNPAPAALCGTEVAGLGLSQSQLNKYNPDTLWNYELGFKSAWMDRRLLVDASVYHIDWNHVQQQIVLGCGYNITANFGNAVSQGGELELKFLPVDAVTLSAGFGYNDAHLKNDVPGTSAKDGDRLVNVPRFTGSVGAEYRRRVNADYDGFARADMSYVGDSNFLYDRNSPFYRRKGFATTNIRIGVEGRNGFDISLYATNLFDKHGETDLPVAISADLPTTRRVAINQPRTIGVTVQYQY